MANNHSKFNVRFTIKLFFLRDDITIIKIGVIYAWAETRLFAFDENPRTELSSEFKAIRPSFADVPDEENPLSQLSDIYATLVCMRIVHTEIANGEADDAIAAYILTYGIKTQIVLLSFDSDLFQLINKNVSSTALQRG